MQPFPNDIGIVWYIACIIQNIGVLFQHTMNVFTQNQMYVGMRCTETGKDMYVFLNSYVNVYVDRTDFQNIPTVFIHLFYMVCYCPYSCVPFLLPHQIQ